MNNFFISQSSSITLVIITCLIFTFFGILYSKKFQGLKNYLTANRDIGLFSLTTSLTASALGAWILFGPVAASTWGGIGAIIGYSLGTAFPMIFLIFLGKKIRQDFPKGSSLIEFLRKKFGKSLFKLILLMTIFYMFIFLCAEITAVSVLINYISGTPLWLTALIVLLATLTYTLYGGLRASLFTDNIQMVLIIILLIISFFIIQSFVGEQFTFDFLQTKKPAFNKRFVFTWLYCRIYFLYCGCSYKFVPSGKLAKSLCCKRFFNIEKKSTNFFFNNCPNYFLYGFCRNGRLFN